MKKILTSICAILACEHLLSNDGKVTLEDAQLNSLEAAISADKKTIADLQGQVQGLQDEKKTLTTEKQQLETANQQLKAEVEALKQKPGDTTAHVVNDKHEDKHDEKSEAELYFESRANAKALYDALP